MKHFLPKTILVLFAFLFLVSCSGKQVIQDSAAASPENTPTFTPTVNSELPGYTSTTLEIVRNGKKYSVLLGYNTGQAIQNVTPQPGFKLHEWYGNIRQTNSADLEWYGDFDSDGETEYLVTAYQVYATLNVSILAVDYVESVDEYRIFDEINLYALCFQGYEDLEKDGIPEIITKDQDFHFDTGGAVADKAISPIKIFRYDGHNFISVTQEYPDRIEQDAKHWLEKIHDQEQAQYPSLYASYLADMYLLGRQEEGIQVFLELCNQYLLPSNKAYNPESTFTCEHYLLDVQGALKKSGYK